MNSSSRQGHQKQHPLRRWQRIRLEMSEQVRLTAYHEVQQDAPDWGWLAGQQCSPGQQAMSSLQNSSADRQVTHIPKSSGAARAAALTAACDTRIPQRRRHADCSQE
jgi:hypothetical protein